MVARLNILTIPASNGLLMPITGAQSRLLQLVKRLTSIGDNVIIIEDKRYSDIKERKLVTPYTFTDLQVVGRRLVILRDLNIGFIRALLKVLRNEDVTLIEFSYPAGVVATKCITRLLGKRTPIIYAPYDFGIEFVEVIVRKPTYTHMDRLILRKYIRIMEWLTCTFIADHIIVVSDRDRELFIDTYRVPNSKIIVIPSGSNIVDFSADRTENVLTKSDLGTGANNIVIFFHGLYRHPQNKEAYDIIINDIAPQFESDSRVVFVVGGTGAPKFSTPNVHSIGFIRDLPNTLANVDIAIVPVLRGGGTKLKVLDYLAAGLPIVTTKKGAQGIDIINGEQAIIVDGVRKEFIDALKLLINNEGERERLGSNARLLAEQRYDWAKIGDKLHNVYEQLSSSASGLQTKKK